MSLSNRFRILLTQRFGRCSVLGASGMGRHANAHCVCKLGGAAYINGPLHAILDTSLILKCPDLMCVGAIFNLALSSALNVKW